ncbi:hypothetical protein WK32_33755 [Burkholderia vietnamiensis]|uniref:Uncharacterized protein n=1 Tax=Burkholderia vietnamiensis TaxID=60552 RepID=A0AA45BCN8_BURVI|nr:hypothetical protein WK32_33755 [Burkholderia vietnamiensis]PRH39776.1 hypothetical protein C6T65_24255 [Burkholderia vietnamiensis]
MPDRVVLHDDPVSVCRLTGVPSLRIGDKRERRAQFAVHECGCARRRGERPPERAAGKVSDTR